MAAEPTVTPPARHGLSHGEFAPVFWEPLGRRGERLVVGILLTDSQQITRAHQILHHKRLLDFINEGKSTSADGVIRFALEHFGKTLEAGGIIADLRAPFASMSIGRTEPISGRSDAELLERATRLCTLLGHMPEQPKPDGTRIAAKTMGFLRSVRQHVRAVDAKLARAAMKHEQWYPVGESSFRVHFRHEGHYAQFCSLPLPSARADLATEATARLTELSLIRKMNPAAEVQLFINSQTLALARDHLGRRNATLQVRERTIEMARALDIDAAEYIDPLEASVSLRRFASTTPT